MARILFENLNKGRGEGLPPMAWEEFKVTFLERFLPESGGREAKDRGIERLRQTSDMSVAEYDVKFTQ